MCKALLHVSMGLVIGSVVGLIIIMLGELTSTPTVCPLPENSQVNVLSLE